MNSPTPVRPAHVPTLTEVVEPAQDDQGMQMPAPAWSADPDDVPRNLMRGLAPTPPAPLPEEVARQPASAVTFTQDLISARANLSGALRSARDDRWAPMPNVELPATADVALQPTGAQIPLPELGALLEAPLGAPQEVTEVSEAQLMHRVLGVVQKQIDGMLDYRLREAMTPILQRHTDALVRDLRDELKQTMQDVINRAVAQEMAKVRQR